MLKRSYKSKNLMMVLVTMFLGQYCITSFANEPNADKQEASAQTIQDQGGSEKTESKEEKPEEVNKKNDQESDGVKVDLGGLNLRALEVKKLLPLLAKWTKKIIEADPGVMSIKLSIFADIHMSQEKILEAIYRGLKRNGYVVQEDGDYLLIMPITDAKLDVVRILSDDQPLAAIVDKTQVFQKIFKLKVPYSAAQMEKLVAPLMSKKNSQIVVDTNTNALIVIDTVSSLMQISKVIESLDVEEVERTEHETIIVEFADTVLVSQVISIMIKQGGGAAPARRSRSGSYRSQSSGSAASSVSFVGPSGQPVVLLPVPERHCIITRASKEDMVVIKAWAKKLDIIESDNADYDVIQIEFIDVLELARTLNSGLSHMQGADLKTEIRIEPVPKARQILVFGSEQNRIRVRNMVLELDLPSNNFITEQFQLKHADPDKLKDYIEDLFGEEKGEGYYYRRYGNKGNPEDKVRVISYSMKKQVTVIASAENIAKVRTMVEEWDQPIDITDLLPLIYTFKNTDPVAIEPLLTNMFTDEGSQSLPWYYPQPKVKKIVGQLFGLLTFEAIPNTKKMIIVSQVPEGYVVIKELLDVLDREDMAELPVVVELKYADAEDLCDQLNALLNERGSAATLMRSTRGLTLGSSINQNNDNNKNNNKPNNNQNNQGSEIGGGVIKPWWSTGHQPVDSAPSSNLIGKLRFIPVHRSKAILVLTPLEYKESIINMINLLDKPGKQVVIKAAILQVDQGALKSLGVKVSENPNAFGTIGESTLKLLTELVGSKSDIDLGDGVRGGVTVSGNISVLIDLLEKEANAKILNQPTLWTMDNKEASFFKGLTVGFLDNARITSEGTKDESFKYEDVGVSLKVRPSITPENAVNMTVSLEITQINAELINTQIARDKLQTSTSMNALDGETLMLGGILYQNDVDIQVKVPLLGDLPLIGPLFRHIRHEQTNSELLVFMTPKVIDVTEKSLSLRDVSVLSEAYLLLDEVKASMAKNVKSIDKQLGIKN